MPSAMACPTCSKSRNRAKSRQFSADMDIFAEVIENGARSALLGYREDLWTKNTGMDKRLVFKLFTESLNWRATMDLMVGRSLQLTLGARGLPVTAFSINTGDHDNMVYLERSAHKWPLLPEHFSFFLLEDGRPAFFRLRRDFIDVGGELTLQARLKQGWQHIYRVIPYPRYDGEYEITNWYTATHPDTLYQGNIIVAKPGPNRSRITMYNARVSVRDAEGHAEKRWLETESEFRNVLRGEFGLNMSDQQIDECVAVMKAKGTGDVPHPFFA